MKIYFFWPFNSLYFRHKRTLTTKINKFSITFGEYNTEPYEFFKALIDNDSIELINNFQNADYVIYMMDYRNCYSMNHYNQIILNIPKIKEMCLYRQYHKEIIIDYNDWIDTRNVPNNIFPLVKKYFKRSIIDKYNNKIVEYSRDIIYLTYGIRSDYLLFDSDYNKLLNNNDNNYKYDVCCLFDFNDKQPNSNRSKIVLEVGKYDGAKFVGTVNRNSERYCSVNEEYYNILKNSKIIVTANPYSYEGDYRLYEALLSGNLVLCDEMLGNKLLKYPFVNKEHLVYYKNTDEILELIKYYINNEEERNNIAINGKEYVLKYHKFSDRVNEVLGNLI